MPSYTFIIPVKPGGYVKALEWLRRLPPQPHPFEVIIAEGTCPSRQRNHAAAQANGEILYFLDDDSLVSPAVLESCSWCLQDQRVAVVGGPSLTPADDSPLQQLFGQALSSAVGSGGVRNRYRKTGQVRETTERELILCNLAIRREVFLTAGGLDERLYPNEENHLLDKLIQRGWKLIHDPELAIERSQRRTIRQFIRQMFGYGRGRAQQTLIAGMGPLSSYAPLALVVYLALLPLLAAVYPPALFPVAIYALLLLAGSMPAVATLHIPALLCLLPLFLAMHISYGIGLAAGFLVRRSGRQDGRSPAPPVNVRLLKTFGQTEW